MNEHPRHAQFLGCEGNKLEADIYGTGERICLLLHGGGQTRHAWRATARKLSENGFTAICLDQRGHGASEWVESKNYRFQYFGEDLLKVCTQLKSKPILIGASMGGIASLVALGKEPCASGLILVDISPFMDKGGVDNIQGFMKAKAKEGFASLEEAASSVANYLPNRKKPPSTEGLKKNLRLKNGRWYWHWDIAFLDEKNGVDAGYMQLLPTLCETSAKLTIPTLLVRGATSDLLTQEQADKFRAICPQAHYLDVAGAGHMVAGDKNDAFSQSILQFIDKI